ncbi:Ammonia transport outward protein 2 [Candida viswanathii]|uniref:Ammonia transport outward protein 2 n=1 Tax=Candida viswanathii TaxID=5486 RepID=A0A367XRJ9_9ASCO|nr:Ammonia transport outward protein 2 [Candida viswanathii]
MPSTSSQKSNPSSIIDPADHADHPVNKVHIAGDGGEFVIINNHKYYRHDLMAAFGGTLNPGASHGPKSTSTLLHLIPNVVVSLACFYGGAAQFLAGLWEFIAGNTFGFTALTSYGAFWLSYAAILIDNFGIGAAYEGTEQMADAVGFFLLGWVIFTFILFLNTLKSTLSFSALAGGVMGVITAFIAWYNALAGTATSTNSYFVPYSVPLPGNVMLKKD